MTVAAPTLVVIGGPNGAGKSTIAPGVLAHLGIATFVNADTIASGLSALHPETRAFEAGRIMLRELHRLAAEHRSFAFESTLASRTLAPWIRRMRESGYRFVLAYVWVQSPDISVERVAARVLAGGHHVDEDTIRRRWSRSLANLWELYFDMADDWRVYDNSREKATRIAFGSRDGEPVADESARWAVFLKTKHDSEPR